MKKYAIAACIAILAFSAPAFAKATKAGMTLTMMVRNIAVIMVDTMRAEVENPTKVARIEIPEPAKPGKGTLSQIVSLS